MNCTSEILHLIPLIRQQLETSQNEEVRLIASSFANSLNELVLSPKNHEDELMKKKNLLECVSLLSSTILYPYIHFVNRSQLTEIKTKASSASKTVDEESKVLPHGFTAPIDSQRAGHNAECASQRMPAVCAAVPFRG